MHTRMLYRALQGSRMAAGYIVQDLALQCDKSEAFIEYTERELGIWPVWLCPLRGISGPTFHPSCEGGEGMVNIGVWGKAKGDGEEFVRQNRELERRLMDLGGRKVLYSQTYYTEDEFWGLYDKGWYDGLRERYGATTLPSVYDRVHVDVEKVKRKTEGDGGWMSRLAGVWPFLGIRGIWWAIKSKDYLIHRQPCWTYWKEAEGQLGAKGTDDI